MSIHVFKLSRFIFPRPAKKTDFRIRFDFRYRRSQTLGINTIIVPGPETHWDGAGLEKNDGTSLREIDLSLVSDWDITFRISADEFYEARIVIYDVRTPGIWARILKAAGKGAGAIPVAGTAIAAVIEAFIAADEDVEKLVEHPLETRTLEEGGSENTIWESRGGGGYYAQLSQKS